MSQSKDKKFRQEFNKKFKDEIQKTAEQLVTQKIQDRENELKKAIWHITRQRDIAFSIISALVISNIIFIYLFIQALLK